MRGIWNAVLLLCGVALPVAVLRYFAKGWLEAAGVPTVVGSFGASLTVVLLVGVVLLFGREGRAESGRYLRAATGFAVLAVWCEILVIVGILAAERFEATTYYSGPWEAVHRAFPMARQHAIGHAQGFLPRLAIALALGGMVYAWNRRSRRRSG
jgi:hypothetical protein